MAYECFIRTTIVHDTFTYNVPTYTCKKYRGKNTSSCRDLSTLYTIQRRPTSSYISRSLYRVEYVYEYKVLKDEKSH